jgi:hypothetical protein
MDFVTILAQDCASIQQAGFIALLPMIAGVAFVAVHNFARAVGVKGGLRF